MYIYIYTYDLPTLNQIKASPPSPLLRQAYVAMTGTVILSAVLLSASRTALLVHAFAAPLHAWPALSRDLAVHERSSFHSDTSCQATRS